MRGTVWWTVSSARRLISLAATALLHDYAFDVRRTFAPQISGKRVQLTRRRPVNTPGFPPPGLRFPRAADSWSHLLWSETVPADPTRSEPSQQRTPCNRRLRQVFLTKSRTNPPASRCWGQREC
jgi:hypothetical protein